MSKHPTKNSETLNAQRAVPAVGLPRYHVPEIASYVSDHTMTRKELQSLQALPADRWRRIS